MLAQVVLAEDGQAAHALLDFVRLPNGGEVAVDKVRGQGRECGAGKSAGRVDTSVESASIPPAEAPITTRCDADAVSAMAPYSVHVTPRGHSPATDVLCINVPGPQGRTPAPHTGQPASP
jgi:hypothetical protein